MKTGNGQNPNPRKVFQKSFRQDNSNLVNAKAPVKFSAKRDSGSSRKK